MRSGNVGAGREDVPDTTVPRALNGITRPQGPQLRTEYIPAVMKSMTMLGVQRQFGTALQSPSEKQGPVQFVVLQTKLAHWLSLLQDAPKLPYIPRGKHAAYTSLPCTSQAQTDPLPHSGEVLHG